MSIWKELSQYLIDKNFINLEDRDEEWAEKSLKQAMAGDTKKAKEIIETFKMLDNKLK